MKTITFAYIGAALCMLVLDSIWLSTMAKVIYRPYLGDMLLDGFRIGPAIVFYLLYVAGIVFFAIMPAVNTGQWTTALVNGAALGLLAYGTYDLTNQATLRTWPTIVTLVDMSWGTVLTAITACAGYFAARLGSA